MNIQSRQADEKYMARCLELASHGTGKVNPNPMVGSVIVFNGKIIGEGYHRIYGEAHAEVNAIASVKDESLLKESTLYVNLEPCSHYGKTPPCAALIIRKQIPRVIVGCTDPYPEVSGRGIKMLQQAGVEVVTGIMEKESYALNKVYMTNQVLKRPYIYLKWAQSADGFMDKLRRDASVKPVILSSLEMLQRVHKKRAEVAAIMVGTRTALLDNPSLTVRRWAGTSPVRVVLDRDLVIPSHYHLVDGSRPTLVFTQKTKENVPPVDYITINYSEDVLSQILSHLYSRRLNSLLVEGGSFLLNQFLQKELWDEIQIETAPLLLGSGVAAPVLGNKPSSLPEKVFTLTEKNAKQHIVSVYSRKN
ncbi:MAG: bifunctional diaminohydroxyphosphoribosylaminopyrimidine deaminase/5-amino-6-(5-phosphoribosylamino)uracil reductase RibD [Tannerellaceae bacterium]|jgi:diaminohydroxyphosphoribosylaminopyrimidine deaminase/5-amino-6-(5-phosphoribosylamino)uracil reductase|nr:bifunctional diaminohydroxyphosphoribosylaminopyrimidine deaminase/5-amino-6-(5-phosphoribosylamino)uracil reductase RibD [Tannerellaceae bacterium]